MTAHVKFLKKYYAAGTFLVSGRKIPRDGGIILAVGKSKQEIEALIKEDPFHKHGLADFRVIEFRASQRADDMPEAHRELNRARARQALSENSSSTLPSGSANRNSLSGPSAITRSSSNWTSSVFSRANSASALCTRMYGTTLRPRVDLLR